MDLDRDEPLVANWESTEICASFEISSGYIGQNQCGVLPTGLSYSSFVPVMNNVGIFICQVLSEFKPIKSGCISVLVGGRHPPELRHIPQSEDFWKFSFNLNLSSLNFSVGETPINSKTSGTTLSGSLT